MSSRLRRRKHKDTTADINITAFMNLMVVLIPFLLLTAVFNRLAILELNLPQEQAAPTNEQQDKPPLVLEVALRDHGFQVLDRLSGPLKRIPKGPDGYDYQALNEYLQRVKERYPDITSVTLLLEDDTAYDRVVQTMDAVRMTREMRNGQPVNAALFPDIALGSAPPAKAQPQQSPGDRS